MARPGSSVLITPGSGESIAAELIASKKYEAWLLADPFGHKRGSRDLFAASTDFFTHVGTTAAVNYAFWNGNADNPTKKIEVVDVVVAKAIASAQTLVRAIRYRLTRITAAATGGTVITPEDVHDTGHAPPSGLDIRYALGTVLTVTATGTSWGFGVMNLEETARFHACQHLFRTRYTGGEPFLLQAGDGFGVHMSNQDSRTISITTFFRVRE